MRLFLEIIEGPLTGQKLAVTEKITVGRKGADVVLNDPKLSGIHALFEFVEDEGWYIRDQKSRNGIWINGMKEMNHAIRDMDEIFMGSSKILCRIQDASSFIFSDRIKQWIESLFEKVKNQNSYFREVKPEIRLKVIQGVQYGQTWDIFYGPRRAGRNSPDICLFEENAPLESFEIKMKGSYAYFYTSNKNVVKINRESVKEKQFEPGDIISIGESEILVEVDEGNGFSR